jgi:hypothetical protein
MTPKGKARSAPSRPIAVAAVALFASVMGCGHAHTEGPVQAPDEKTTATGTPSDAKHTDNSLSEPKHATVTSGLKGPNGEAQNISIATSPASLLKPGAAKTIEEKLRREGDLKGDADSDDEAGTREALARFQRRHNLPATGAPDDATVQKLGLKPQDIFRSGNDRPKE